MDLGKIGGMTPGDLRRFIVNLLQSEPGIVPNAAAQTDSLPAKPHTDGDVPVWNASTNSWAPSSSYPVPISGLTHKVLQGPTDGTQYQFSFGALAAVNADGGGWCNYTISPPWTTATDLIIAVNSFAGTSGAGFLDIQVQTRTTFRCFVNTVGLNCSATWFGIGH